MSGRVWGGLLHDPNIRRIVRERGQVILISHRPPVPNDQGTHMTPSNLSTRSPFHRRVAGAATATGVAFALVVGGGAIAAQAATPTTHSAAALTATSTTPTTTTPATARPSGAAKVKLAAPFRDVRPAALHALIGQIPASLRTDVKALKGLKGAARRTAVAAIETKAVGGTYGTTLKSAAIAAESAWKTAPASLKKDLRSLKGMSKPDRAKELAAIESKAVAGTYGATIETYAKSLRSQEATRTTAIVGSLV